ncbi:MAG: cob(I)yrinic acid a,c-diamide adenosyltransferase [Eubacteriales bacterium]|nr:cob(I)yrinic acid a,c-diamide adenosyltransferase [Eubacteriales bacterium]
MDNNRLHLYTGNGKGKTTAAMGLALRMLGHGEKALIAQFMKDGTSGELKALSALPNVKIFEGARMQGFIWRMGEAQLEKARQENTEAITRLVDEIKAFEPRLTVLDELAVALAVRLISQEDAWLLIDTALEYGDTVVTGRYAGEKLMQKADYISRIEAEKHPFEEGQPARRGIEF